MGKHGLFLFISVYFQNIALWATFILPKSPTFLGNFCKVVKIFHFCSEITLGNFYRHLVTFGNWSRWQPPTFNEYSALDTFGLIKRHLGGKKCFKNFEIFLACCPLYLFLLFSPSFCSLSFYGNNKIRKKYLQALSVPPYPIQCDQIGLFLKGHW